MPFSFHFLTNTVNVEQYNQDIRILDLSKKRVCKIYWRNVNWINLLLDKMGKATYREAWEKDFRLLKRTVDSSCALCKLCQKTFKIDASGISQVKLRTSGAKHKERGNILAGNSSQSHFTASDGKTAPLSKGWDYPSFENVDGNFSFASANGDGDRFHTMFPDSAIAKSYKQGETKVKYCLQYGIAPHLKDLIVKDLANSPFTFKFDETTTSQVRK